jgi:hypothetical protein
MLARRSHLAVTAVVALDRRIDKGLQDLNVR